MISVLAVGHSPLAQEFAKKGCPIGFRARLWCQILNIAVDEVVSTYVFDSLNFKINDKIYFQEIKLKAERFPMMRKSAV